MSLMLRGTGVSRGIAIGRVRLLHEIQPRAVASHVKPKQIAREIDRLTNAMHEAITELRELQSRLKNRVPAEILTFFDSHLLMLEDSTLSQPVIDLIREQGYTSEWALALHRDNLVSLFEGIEDNYLRQRSEDIENVISKVLRRLSGSRPGERRQPDEKYIVVTRTIAPSDVIEHQNDGMLGLICTHGGNMSHATIVARSLRIPTVAAVHPALELLLEQDEVIVDGGSGMILAAPDRMALRHYRQTQREEKRRQRELRSLRDRKTKTRDGVVVTLLANVDSPADATAARRVGAEGVGLFRSEALYLNRAGLPGEGEQLKVYRRLLRAMQGRPVTLRTMDIWPGEPSHDSLYRAPPPEPALGMRGIRLAPLHPEIFETQIRAMLRASTTGPTRILLPMVSNVSELHAARATIDKVRTELAAARRATAPIELGVLIEVPAAALSCRLYLPYVDFLAIGTNDLAQYTLAVARDDDDVQYLYDPLHPAVLRLICEVIAAGRHGGKPVVLCGELASDPRMCPLLLGLGLRHFSVHPSTLLDVKDAILRTDVAKISGPARRALNSDSRVRTERLLDRIAPDR